MFSAAMHQWSVKSLVVVLLWAGVLPVFCAERSESQIRVASYNLENFLWMENVQPDGTISRRFKSDESIAALVGVIVELNADVLMVSEIGTAEDSKRLQSLLADAGLDYTTLVHLEGADDVRMLGVLARVPLVEDFSRGLVAFEAGGQREFIRRGILDVALQMPDGSELRLVGLHLKSKLETPADQELLRRHEAHWVREHLDSIVSATPNTQLMVVGDFNDLINSVAVREIMGVRGQPGSLQALPLEDRVGDRWTHYWEEADLYSRIDFILVDDGMRRISVKDSMGVFRSPDWRMASDHRPVWADFDFSER